MNCERGGKYKKISKKLKHNDTCTRKYGCSFRLCGHYSSLNIWAISIVCGVHDHDLDCNLEGHPFVGHLKLWREETC